MYRKHLRVVGQFLNSDKKTTYMGRQLSLKAQDLNPHNSILWRRIR